MPSAGCSRRACIFLATRDQMTGLFNGHRFEEELSRFLARGRRYGGSGALLIFDLDRMKAVNDNLGHLADDQMLRAVAAAMSARLRESDTVGRLGGDEFAILLLDLDEAVAARLANDLLERVRAIHVDTPSGRGWTTASVGIAYVSSFDGLDSDELIRVRRPGDVPRKEVRRRPRRARPLPALVG